MAAQSATIAFLSPGRAGERIVAVATEIAVVGRVAPTKSSPRVMMIASSPRSKAFSRATGGTVINQDQG